MPADLTQDILNSDVITLLTRSIPNPELISDTAANDSDKTLTVDADEIWEILWIWLEFTTTGTSNNRTIHVDLRDDSDNVIFGTRAITDQAPSTTEYYLLTALGQAPVIWRTSRHIITIPPKTILPAGYDIRIYDTDSVDAAADDMIIRMMVNRYDV